MKCYYGQGKYICLSLLVLFIISYLLSVFSPKVYDKIIRHGIFNGDDWIPQRVSSSSPGGRDIFTGFQLASLTDHALHTVLNVNVTEIPADDERQWEDRQKRRLANVQQYCYKHGSSLETNLTEMLAHTRSRSGWSGNFLVSDQYQFIYCNVPKVASTSLKLLLANLTGNLTADQVPKYLKYFHLNKYLRPAGLRGLEDYTAEGIQHRLKKYSKFVFVRHPVERLVSAYRDKVEKDFIARPTERRDYNVSFAKFVDFVLSEKSPMNTHWEPYHQACFPCFVHYDYIGKLESLDEDIRRIVAKVARMMHTTIGKVRVPRTHISPVRTNMSIVHSYLSTLSSERLRGINDLYQADFRLFGYKVLGIVYNS